jgi:hypothetical protein
MTTYSVQAIYNTGRDNGFENDDTPLSIQTTNILMTVEDSTTVFNYGIEFQDSEDVFLNSIDDTYVSLRTPDGRNLNVGLADDASLSTIFWSSGQTTVLNVYFPLDQNNEYEGFLFDLGGATLPFFTNVNQIEPFVNSVTGFTSTLNPDPGAGDTITFASLGAVLSTQNDVFVFDDANQWHNVGLGSDSIDGGGGSDMISFVSSAAALNIDMDAGTASGTGVAHTFQNFENVTGSIFGDYIVGDDASNRLRGLGDYDWFVGSGGNDRYDGGNGRDMVSYIDATSAVLVRLGGGTNTGLAAGDQYTSIERVTGSSFADVFYGSNGQDDFRGQGGYDTFIGSGGGKDRYYGGSGLDTVSYIESGAGVTASLFLGRGSTGDAARDLYFDIENLGGTDFDDVLTGDTGRNYLYGEGGADLLIANAGVDRLFGGAGSDTMDGGTGWDYAVYDGVQADYTFQTDGSGVTSVTNGGDTDYLTNIEVLSFADGDVIL